MEKVQTIVTKFTEYKNKYKEIIGNLRRIIMLNKIGLVFQGNKTSKILNFVFSIKWIEKNHTFYNMYAVTLLCLGVNSQTKSQNTKDFKHVLKLGTVYAKLNQMG